jgi:hypothetical protein
LGVTVLLTIVALSFLVVAVYHEAAENGFQFDDLQNIRDNPSVRLDSFSIDGLLRAGTEAQLANRKLAYVSFALDWWRGGGEPGAFQQTNVVLHAVNSILVFLLLLVVLNGGGGRLGRTAVGAALGAAAIWAAHPIQVQAVTYIVQRMAVLACGFTTAAVILYIVGRRCRSRSQSVVWFGLCGLALLGGAMSKENAWIAPFLLILAELGVVRHDAPLTRSRFERTALGAVIAIAVLMFIVTMAGVGPVADRFEGGFSHRDFTMQQRVLTQPRVLFFHFSQIMWPVPARFSLEHDFETSTSLIHPAGTLPAWMALIGWCVVGTVLLARRGRRKVGFFVLWLPMTLAIESSFVNLEMVFEHRMYLPSIGLAGLAALALYSVGDRVKKPSVRVGGPVALIIILLSLSTMARVPVWQTPLTLYRDCVRNAPTSARVWSNLGRACLQYGDRECADEAVRRALELDPELPDARESLGILLFDVGDLAGARKNFEFALNNGLATPSVANHLGEVELAEGNFEMAELRFSQAITAKPWVSTYRWNRALALERLGRSTEACSEWEMFLGLESDAKKREMVRTHIETNYPGKAH